MNEQEQDRLQRALDHAVKVIESYQMDIRNSAWTGVDLVDKGFCQGCIYLTALDRIRAIASGQETP